MLTFLDVVERLKKQDEVSLLETLEINAEELVDRFLDRVEDKLETLQEDLDDDADDDADPEF